MRAAFAPSIKYEAMYQTGINLAIRMRAKALLRMAFSIISVVPLYLNEKELSRLNRLVTMFIDYAELMAEDEQLMSMQDWLNETDRFLTNNRRNVLDGKGHISREAAAKKVGAIYDQFRKKQDAEYISEFDRQTEKYLKGE